MINRLITSLILTSIIISIPIYMILSVPKYPIINSSISKEQISNNINKIIKENSKKFSFENMDNKKQLIKYEESLYLLAKNLDNCKTKECLIEEYNNFMDDWVADSLKVEIRYYAMSIEYGVVGNLLSQSFPWLYQYL
ncbi:MULTISPECIES: hypothetical protein [Arcobacteraceae]|uniref:Uncharacterized protein n=3 Tax=Arcobacteraceae TaxID=2808963 RepID=A0ABX2YB69_9BACT|nr:MULTISPECIES: hypothetical protein [Arcobacteraceae]OCL81984.1 hypothetical protein AAW29_01698 [Arcobacter porcinus]OCL86159.1 hypothetical protein AAX30_01497 [Arcobacter porcinus]OCL90304.1 hypothetical protein AAX28_01785 [Arcobacter porcinus]OCL90610.1 hypothetical protein AAX25_01710 [Aliarcobacter thereius]OCL95623.1 hypothetical protein AA347_01096 [Aliarcobacter thereius LMG 24486]